MPADDATAGFNAWMTGLIEYDALSPAAKALADEYLDEYWERVDDLCRHVDA